MPGLENVFSWSKSRAEEFNECKRKYYFARYLSWGGWEAAAPAQVRLAYILKNLKNRWAWKGEVVHHVIETAMKALRSDKPMSEAELTELLTKTMRENYLSSKAKKYMKDPKRNLGLFEHEYAKPVDDATWKKIHDEAATCLRNLLHSALYKEFAADERADWLVIEDLEEFDFNGAKIYVKLDFARKHDGKIEIIDWKTGKEEKEAATIQVGAYAIYAMKKWKVPLESIRAYLVYLTNPVPSLQEQPLSKELIKETEAFMTESVGQMQALLVDVPHNVPKGREAFPFTENTRFCSNCSFYQICEKYTKSQN